MNWYTTIHQKYQVPKMEALIYVYLLLPAPPKQPYEVQYFHFRFVKLLGITRFTVRWKWLYSTILTCILHAFIYPLPAETWINSGVFGGFHSLGAQTGIAQGACRCWCFRLPGLVAKLVRKISWRSSLGKKSSQMWCFCSKSCQS